MGPHHAAGPAGEKGHVLFILGRGECSWAVPFLLTSAALSGLPQDRHGRDEDAQSGASRYAFSVLEATGGHSHMWQAGVSAPGVAGGSQRGCPGEAGRMQATMAAGPRPAFLGWDTDDKGAQDL